MLPVLSLEQNLAVAAGHAADNFKVGLYDVVLVFGPCVENLHIVGRVRPYQSTHRYKRVKRACPIRFLTIHQRAPIVQYLGKIPL